MRRSLMSTLVAAALAVVFASSYAGPVVCATVHAHPVSTDATAGHEHEECGRDAAPSVQLTGPTDAASCPDALHCGPSVIARLPQAVAGFDALPFDEATRLGPSLLPARLTQPTTPPPRV